MHIPSRLKTPLDCQAVLPRSEQPQGMTVDPVGTAKRNAEANAGHYRLDVVILDLGLPDEDGLLLLRALFCVSKEGEACPVLVLTARMRSVTALPGLQAGADDYLVKPFWIYVN